MNGNLITMSTMLQRIAAGWMDYLVALFPVYAILMLTVGGKALVVDPLILLARRYILVINQSCYVGINLFHRGAIDILIGKILLELTEIRSIGFDGTLAVSFLL